MSVGARKLYKKFIENQRKEKPTLVACVPSAASGWGGLVGEMRHYSLA